MKKLLAIIAIVIIATSCMSDKTYMLEKKDTEIKAKHSETYVPIKITGPLQIDKDSSIEIRVPSQPFAQSNF